MWTSLADSIHKIILIIVKIFDIKSSLPRTPTLLLQSLSSSIVNCYIFKFVFIQYSVHSQPCSLPVTVICIYLKQFLYIPLDSQSTHPDCVEYSGVAYTSTLPLWTLHLCLWIAAYLLRPTSQTILPV